MTVKTKIALLANEGGRGLGHVKRLNTIAAGLKNRGWRTVLAPFRISSLDRAAYAFDDALPAPGWPRFQQESWFESGSEKDMLINSYAVIGADFGMADPRAVTNIIQAWDSIMNFVSPSVVVGDFAPGAMIAAYGRCPAIAVGTGFTVPAVVNGRFLPFQEQRGTDNPVQDRIKAAVCEAMKRAGHGIPDDPLIAVRGEIPFPICYKSFDVARGRRIEPVLPPDIQAFEDTGGRPPAGVGAYFGPDIQTYAHLLQLFGTLRPKPVIALEGAEANIRKAASRAGLLTRDTLYSPQDIARGCRVFLHHGGLGTSQLCALIGVPQLIIFCDTEKWMNAEAVKEQGAGIGIPIETADRANIEGALNALLNEPRFKKAALAWSEMLKSERSAGSTASTICDSICGAV
jgi:UDP:flavonoid glycosyltransferase YjiC (YdhE family)